MPQSDWKVQLFPEEEAFINEVMKKKLDNEDGYGEFIAPIRGGLIYMSDYDFYTEDQIKWLVFHRLVTNPSHRVPGFDGLKFMNFSYNGPVPKVEEDAEAMDKWGVKRMTTSGQPVDDHIGHPIETVFNVTTIETVYRWDEKGYLVADERELSNKFVSDTDNPVPEKLVV